MLCRCKCMLVLSCHIYNALSEHYPNTVNESREVKFPANAYESMPDRLSVLCGTRSSHM